MLTPEVEIELQDSWMVDDKLSPYDCSSLAWSIDMFYMQINTGQKEIQQGFMCINSIKYMFKMK